VQYFSREVREVIVLHVVTEFSASRNTQDTNKEPYEYTLKLKVYIGECYLGRECYLKYNNTVFVIILN
jgi:hypothetical protein